MNRFTRLIFTLLIAASVALPAWVLADDHAGVQTADSQSALTPSDALNLLKEGNERFLSGEMINRDLPAQVAATASGQFPHSVVLSCIDSRVPPELVFDQGLGDIFSPRVAGNFVDEELLGSMEFAAAVAGSKVIVVLGHTECGAVKGACDDVKLGNLTATLANIRPAVEAVSGIPGERNSKNKAFVDAVAHQNVKMTVDNILDRSLVLRELVDKGRLMVVGAMYDVATGKVTFMD
ncbi:MAG: carbonic anhydrase family protein [Lysobacterales bacterium]|jgi:carbonic anhydrase